MSNENDNERLSGMFDGELGGDISGDKSRENWKIYSIIGDSLRDGPQNLTRDISAKVRLSLEDIAANESIKKGFWTGLLSGSLFGYLRGFCQFPKTVT